MLNRGIAFGLWQGVPVWIVGVVLIGLGVVAGKTRELWGRGGIGLVICGGVINLIDRIRYGGVSDNLMFIGLVYNNLADYLIVIGLVVYGYTYFVRRQRDGRDRQTKRDNL
ncbi:MAG: signal peptidase II [bacterium]